MVNVSSKNQVRRERALVISCYDWEWQVALTLEGASELVTRNYEVEYLQLSSFATRSVKNFLKSILRETISNGSIKRILNSDGISVEKPIFQILKANILVKILYLVPWNTTNMLESRWDIIRPGIIDLTKNININAKDSTYRRKIKKVLVEDIIFTKFLKNWSAKKNKFDLILIVNGRFPRNRSARFFFKKQEVKIEYIEFGSNREKFQIYSGSPHSIINRQFLFSEYIKDLDIPKDIVDYCGSKFFKSRRNFDYQANISWTRNMNLGNIPRISPEKKVCTFFTTSEIEFVGTGDATPVGFFRNQVEGFTSLIKCLGSDWQIFLRRHPSSVDKQIDFETVMWSKFGQYPNVEIIDPDSAIDSYALGLRSDLVAHFGSFIGPELIFAGHQNVISLGPTAWQDLDLARHLRSENQISAYLNSSFDKPVWVDINLIGYYMANFGKPFKLMKWNQSMKAWVLKL